MCSSTRTIRTMPTAWTGRELDDAQPRRGCAPCRSGTRRSRPSATWRARSRRWRRCEPDRLMREAIALQGYEEGRHSRAARRHAARTTTIPHPPSREEPHRGRSASGTSSGSATASASTPSSPSGSTAWRATRASSRPRCSRPSSRSSRKRRATSSSSSTGSPTAGRPPAGAAKLLHMAALGGWPCRCRCGRASRPPSRGARWRRRRQRRGRLHARRQGLARGGQLAAPVPRSLPARKRPPPGAVRSAPATADVRAAAWRARWRASSGKPALQPPATR